MKKDDFVTLTIEDMGVDGEGIGHVDGCTLFVKDALIGDVINAKVMKMKKNYGYARMMEILTPSPDRVEPKCAFHKQCGGCQIQALSYEKQLEYKKKKVLNNLQRIGGLNDLPEFELIGMEEPYCYRNKAQFPFGTDKNGDIVAGFYAGRTHSIISNTKCYLGVEENEQILKIILAHLEKYHIPAYDEQTGKGLLRHVLIRKGFTTGELMVCLILNGTRMPEVKELVAELTKIPGMTSITINVNTKNTNVIMGQEMRSVWGQDYITDYIGNVKYQISPLSFFQVNPVQTRKLYERALEYAELERGETVWDLYCGIGTISLFLAQKAKQVYGVEIVPQAIDDAKKNAALNGFTNAEFYVGKAEEVLPTKYREEGIQADVIVVDPPRKGCDEALLQTIVQMAPKRVVYVSCDSATLARDLKYLVSEGYEVKKGTVVDQFPHTVHVETVVLLSRKKVNDRINFDINIEALPDRVSKTATYAEIKAYVLEHYGLKVSSLYIAQIKEKHGIKERENYNIGEGKSKELICPPEKEEAITNALKHFNMI